MVSLKPPFLKEPMTKVELELCRKIVSMFNKASFTVSGYEMVTYSNDLSAFGRMIMEKEKALTMPIVPVEQKTEVKPAPRVRTRGLNAKSN